MDKYEKLIARIADIAVVPDEEARAAVLGAVEDFEDVNGHSPDVGIDSVFAGLEEESLVGLGYDL